MNLKQYQTHSLPWLRRQYQTCRYSAAGSPPGSARALEDQ